MPAVLPPDRESLDILIVQRLDKHGPRANLNDIDVSAVQDLSFLFAGKSFWGDVSQWDTSNATNMRGLFANSHFDGDLSRWDVSQVQDMNMMFEHTQFSGSVARWDVGSVKDFRSMFQDSPFDGDLSHWKIREDAETGFMFGNLPELLSPKSQLALPVIPIKEDMEAVFGYKQPPYQAWLTQRPIDANHWRVLMQVVEASERESWHWESMDIAQWPHPHMLAAWQQMRPVHQGLGLTMLESAQWMMGNAPVRALETPCPEGMFV